MLRQTVVKRTIGIYVKVWPAAGGSKAAEADDVVRIPSITLSGYTLCTCTLGLG